MRPCNHITFLGKQILYLGENPVVVTSPLCDNITTESVAENSLYFGGYKNLQLAL